MDGPSPSRRFPGAEIVEPGLRDLEAGTASVAAAAVAMAATRLRDAGVAVPVSDAEAQLASHRLYSLIAAEEGDAAHSRFNAIAARVVSYARAAERARPG